VALPGHERLIFYFELENYASLPYTITPMKTINRARNGLKAILFDMDGVLVDSMNYHLKSWKELLETFKITVTNEFIFQHEGAMAPEVIINLFRDHGYLIDEEQINDIYRTQNSRFQEHYLSQVGLYPESLSLLDQLTRRGILLGLVTSSRRNLVDSIWKEEHLGFFTTIISADDITRFKPFPDPYLKARDELGQKSENCLVIENAPAGIQAANSAGITCYAISSTLPEEKLSGAQQVFPNLKSLSSFLTKTLL
jgi:beta-phosphoglucomutase